jgi:WD40 repeat protein
MSLRLLPLLALLASGTLRPDEPGKPRLDRDGDPLPPGAVMRLGSARSRPDTPTIAAAFAPDGKTLYTLGNEAAGRTRICAWDPVSGKLLRRVPLPADAGHCFAATADGKALVVGCLRGAVRFLDPVTGAEQRALAVADGTPITHLSLSADDKTLLAKLNTGKVSVWDVETGKERCSTRGSYPAVLPDGKHFVLVLARRDVTLHLMETATGKEVRAFEVAAAAAPPAWPQQPVPCLAVSPDGKLVAFSEGGRRATVWSVETGKVVGRVENPNPLTQALAFAPDSRSLAVGSFSGARLFDAASGKEQRPLDFESGHQCHFLAYASDGKALAGITQEGALHLWDVTAGREVHPVGHGGCVMDLVFLADGKHLVSWGADKRLHAWEVETGREIDQAPGLPFGSRNLTRSADGKGVVWLDGNTLHVWRPGTGMDSRRLDLPIGPGIQSVLSPDGKKAALFSDAIPRLRLVDLEGKNREGRVLTTVGNEWLQAPIFSPDGRRLAIVASDRAIRVWDCVSDREVGTVEADEEGLRLFILMAQPTFSRDGRSLLLSDSNNRLNVWEVAGGRKRAHMPDAPVRLAHATWSPDERLVARGNWDGSVEVLATATGKEVAKWEGGQGTLQSLAFSPDGRLLASGGANGTILVWEIPERRVPKAALSDAQRGALWADLSAADAGRAHRALFALADAPDAAVPLLEERLKTRPAADRQHLEKLIAALDSDDFARREKASEELVAAGAAAEDALRQALEKETSTEVRRRVKEVLERIGRKVAPERLRTVRAIEVLERIGTPAARKVLADLARRIKDPLLEQEIAESLDRLGQRR